MSYERVLQIITRYNSASPFDIMTRLVSEARQAVAQDDTDFALYIADHMSASYTAESYTLVCEAHIKASYIYVIALYSHRSAQKSSNRKKCMRKLTQTADKIVCLNAERATRTLWCMYRAALSYAPTPLAVRDVFHHCNKRMGADVLASGSAFIADAISARARARDLAMVEYLSKYPKTAGHVNVAKMVDVVYTRDGCRMLEWIEARWPDAANIAIAARIRYYIHFHN